MARSEHLVTQLAKMGGIVTHHVIDLGDGTTIGWNKSGPTPTITVHSLDDFHGGQEYTVRGYPNCFDAETVIRRAMSRVGETGYDVKKNNCESFCSWCKTGENHSSQVWFVERVVKRGVATVTKTLAKASVKKASGSFPKKALVGKVITPFVGKALTRTASPWLLAPDIVQEATSIGLYHAGVGKKTDEAVGKSVGFAGSVGVGAALGSGLGPPGMLAGGVIGGGGWLIGELVSMVARRALDCVSHRLSK